MPFKKNQPGWGALDNVLVPAEVVSVLDSVFYEEDLLEQTIRFRRLVSGEGNMAVARLAVECGLAKRLVKLLHRHDDAKLQYEAAWAVTNIAASDMTSEVVKLGVVPIFVEFLSSDNQDLREQAVWALENIAADSAELRDFVIRHGALEPLLSLVNKTTNRTSLQHTASAISYLCQRKPYPPYELVSPALPVLANLFHSTNSEIVADVGWALAALTDGRESQTEDAIKAGILPRAVELVAHPTTAVHVAALRIVGNIASGSDSHTQAVIDCGALEPLRKLLQSSRQSTVKETCWVISNILACSSTQVQSVIDAQIFPDLLEILRSHSDDGVRKEAAWAIANTTSVGSSEQIQFLVNLGSVPELCNLYFDTNDNRTQCVVLEGLQNFLNDDPDVIAPIIRNRGDFEAWSFHLRAQSGSHSQELLQTVFSLCQDALDDETA